ncbi:MAG: alpha-1,2-fucosyltransferase [Planctomycetes bacterium]|nr:alpha-1,2-fucosyltransferase [Planctomycetota bacterium]
MVFLRLMGGMGNQMFQYAMARTLCLKNGNELIIDPSLLSDNESMNSAGLSLRSYALDVFDIPAQITDSQPVQKVLKVRRQDKLKKAAAILFCSIANKFSGSWMVGIVERKKVGFDKSLLNLPSEVYLQGYFPSYKYFVDSEEVIRKEFAFNVEPGQQNRKIIDMISSSNSVSLHVRRGDYVSNEKTKDKFGVCSLEYYKRAVDYISKNVEQPHFFVFTNDLDYVEDNLEINCPATFVTENSGSKSFEDMRLMSLCKHNIIANSSFSWWGAWLNKNPEKIVICPSPAFDKLDIRDEDFYPEDWVSLPKGKQVVEQPE